jgi:hypothetical protein
LAHLYMHRRAQPGVATIRIRLSLMGGIGPRGPCRVSARKRHRRARVRCGESRTVRLLSPDDKRVGYQIVQTAFAACERDHQPITRGREERNLAR